MNTVAPSFEAYEADDDNQANKNFTELMGQTLVDELYIKLASDCEPYLPEHVEIIAQIIDTCQRCYCGPYMAMKQMDINANDPAYEMYLNAASKFLNDLES